MNARSSLPEPTLPPTDGSGLSASHVAQAEPFGMALATENILLRLAIEQMPLGLSMFDAQDHLVLANRRYAAIWGLPEELLTAGTPFNRILKATRGTEVPPATPAPAPLDDQAAVRRREWAMDDGRTVEVVVTSMPDGSRVAVHEDVTEQRRSEARVAFLARHDALTGLPNRHAMLEDLERLLTRHARGEELAVLCLDLDRFKHVNDTLGHAAGDALLRQVAQRLQACARDTDRVVRLGGDEFAVLQCGAAQPASAGRLARRLITALGRPFDLGGHFASIGTSIGIAVAPFDGETADALLKNADLALYRAKSDGRGTLRYFEPAMDERAQARRAMEADLRAAIERHEFELLYRPLVDASGVFAGAVEAVLHWCHPVRGEVAQLDFMPVAEETGLIASIGRWMLRQACRDAASWPASVRVAVAVSAVQFRQGSLLHDATQALKDAGIEAHRLEIEITESVMLEQAPETLMLLQELRRFGMRIALDDFGAGSSPLNQLRSFAFDRIKSEGWPAHDLETPGSQASPRCPHETPRPAAAIPGLIESWSMPPNARSVQEIPGD